MPRPCDHPDGPPQPETGCAVCRKYATDPKYRAFYDGPPPAPRPAARRVPVPLAPCAHLGPPTGEARKCVPCGGNVRIKLRACAKHGACTEHKALDGVPCCTGCPDYARRPPPAPPPRPPIRGKSRANPVPVDGPPGVLITGGIGDLIAVESRLTPAQRARLEAVYYAAPAAEELRQIMAALPGYPRLKAHTILPTGRRTHYTRVTVERVCGRLPKGTEDWSIGRIFPKRLPFVGSSLLVARVADPDRPPGPYVVVVPHSTWGQWPDRNFNPADWRACLDFLDARGVYGVVLCRERLAIPDHPRLLDWQGETTILESAELVKGAQGYVGIDSALSVLAAQVFPARRLAVKGHGGWLLGSLYNYYAPHVEFPFVRPALEAPPWD